MAKYQVTPKRTNYRSMPDVIVKGLLREKLQYILNILKKEGFAAEQLKGLE